MTESAALQASSAETNEFNVRLQSAGKALQRARLETVQVNVGKLCNQTCSHCHVNAGPRRREIMTRETMAEVLAFIDRSPARCVDITGGEVAMNPDFRWLASRLHERGLYLMIRTNLTIMTEPGFEDLPEFYRDLGAEVIASLPCYTPENVDAQRGEGVFVKSLQACRKLNEAGYGKPGTELTLNFVYNPGGAFLPPPQAALEADYRAELGKLGIHFNHLFTITNMPIARFATWLRRQGRLDEYQQLLEDNFNSAAVDGLMCRSLVSIGWDGYLYDCDFNQMLDMPIRNSRPLHVRDVTVGKLQEIPICTGRHCFGCTAGTGSSCGGALV